MTLTQNSVIFNIPGLDCRIYLGPLFTVVRLPQTPVVPGGYKVYFSLGFWRRNKPYWLFTVHKAEVAPYDQA